MLRKSLLAATLVSGCELPDPSINSDQDAVLSSEIQEKLEDLKEIAPQLFANTTLTAATRLAFDSKGNISTGEVVAHVTNFNCAAIDDELKTYDEGNVAQLGPGLEAFMRSLSENNAAIIKGETESGIKYSFQVDCGRAPIFDLVS